MFCVECRVNCVISKLPVLTVSSNVRTSSSEVRLRVYPRSSGCEVSSMNSATCTAIFSKIGSFGRSTISITAYTLKERKIVTLELARR